MIAASQLLIDAGPAALPYEEIKGLLEEVHAELAQYEPAGLVPRQLSVQEAKNVAA